MLFLLCDCYLLLLCRNAINVIGNGVVVHVPSLFEEIAELEQKGVDVSDVNSTYNTHYTNRLT